MNESVYIRCSLKTVVQACAFALANIAWFRPALEDEVYQTYDVCTCDMCVAIDVPRGNTRLWRWARDENPLYKIDNVPGGDGATDVYITSHVDDARINTLLCSC